MVPPDPRKIATAPPITATAITDDASRRERRPDPVRRAPAARGGGAGIEPQQRAEPPVDQVDAREREQRAAPRRRAGPRGAGRPGSGRRRGALAERGAAARSTIQPAEPPERLVDVARAGSAKRPWPPRRRPPRRVSTRPCAGRRGRRPRPRPRRPAPPAIDPVERQRPGHAVGHDQQHRGRSPRPPRDARPCHAAGRATTARAPAARPSAAISRRSRAHGSSSATRARSPPALPRSRSSSVTRPVGLDLVGSGRAQLLEAPAEHRAHVGDRQGHGVPVAIEHRAVHVPDGGPEEAGERRAPTIPDATDSMRGRAAIRSALLLQHHLVGDLLAASERTLSSRSAAVARLANWSESTRPAGRMRRPGRARWRATPRPRAPWSRARARPVEPRAQAARSPREDTRRAVSGI